MIYNLKRKLLFITVLLLFAAGSVLVYSLIWGKLFPYSPIITGFSRHELANSIIYIEKGNRFTDYDWVDSILPRVEEFHELSFKKKPRIFFFADNDTYSGRAPSRARFCAFYNGAIVVSPWAQDENAEGKISLYVYLRHELSHSLLYQNMNILRSLSYPRWLLEGIATYSADQRGTFVYPGKKETYNLIRQGNWMPPDYFSTSREEDVVLNVKYKFTFMYSQFACIVDDLITIYGREKFLDYMKELLSEKDHDAVFTTTFGIDFHDYIDDFRKRIINLLPDHASPASF